MDRATINLIIGGACRVRVGLRSAIRENILISRVLTSEVVGEAAEAQSFGRGGCFSSQEE